MTASSPAEPPESTLAAVIASHRECFRMNRRGDLMEFSCNITVPLDSPSMEAAHVAAAILAATPTAAHVAELEAALAAAEARLRAVEALHGGTHWCFDSDGQDCVYEPETKWWPCPTFALATQPGPSS